MDLRWFMPKVVGAMPPGTKLVHTLSNHEKVRLRQIDPAETFGLDKKDAKERLEEIEARLVALQEKLYAAGCNAVLIVLQGIDTSGKDGTIRRVMRAVNPAGCRVESFKVPTPLELQHDFLWRVHQVTPKLGMMSIFNRSHYEDVLVVRVHKLVPKHVWETRYDRINEFERLLSESGTIVLKFMLHVSKKEQRDRLLAREADKEKAWKLSTADWPEHERYDEYVEAYQDAIERCSTPFAPWNVVPADRKWYRDLAIAQTIVDVLSLHEKRWHEDLELRGVRALHAIKENGVRESVSAL
jgi:PPK2 family polyphosphate:nucleotide phosphotransferase